MKALNFYSILSVGLVALFFSLSLSADPSLRGRVRVDGSSTVFPISEAIAEEFGKVYPRVRVMVAASGTGGGFRKFSLGETDINNASRNILPPESEAARSRGVDYVSLPVAYDGITIVVNKENTWVDHLTVAELKKIWGPNSQVQKWSDIRPEWPNEKILLYGPGTDSGTFDYFTEAINGKSHVSRSDFTKSEDDNVLVQGVAGDRYSLGYFGYAYYHENAGKLRAIPIDNGKGPVFPSDKTINSGQYAPLSRPVYIYVSKKSAKDPAVRAFVDFYILKASGLVKDVGYIALPDETYLETQTRFHKSL